MKRLDLLAAAVLAVGGIGLAASPGFAQQADQAAQPQQQQQAGQPAATPAAQPSDSAAGAGAAAGAQSAADRAGSSAIASEAEVRPVLAQTAQAILTKGGASGLTQQLSSKDQDRLKDFSKDAAQLDQTIEQVRQAYKEKYQKDLDLTASADQVFTMEFFRIGGAGETARQASAQIGADTSGAASGAAAGASGTAGASGASGAASGQAGGAAGGAAASDAAQTAANAAGGQMAVITIPASHDMPETRINLVKEGGSWKIDVPDSVDGQKLSQNLQTQLQQCASSKEKWPADANEASRAISHSVFIVFAGEQAGAASGATGASGASGTVTPDAGATPAAPATPATPAEGGAAR